MTRIDQIKFLLPAAAMALNHHYRYRMCDRNACFLITVSDECQSVVSWECLSSGIGSVCSEDFLMFLGG